MRKTIFLHFVMSTYLIACTPSTCSANDDKASTVQSATSQKEKEKEKKEREKKAKEEKKEREKQEKEEKKEREKREKEEREREEDRKNQLPPKLADDDEHFGRKLFVYDPKKHRWGVYDTDGTLLKSGPGSSGKDYCPDIDAPCRTPSGTFKLIREDGADCVSSIFPLASETHPEAGGAKMPYCMFFNGGYAIHGSNDVPRNKNASHGCIRVLPDDAQWLHDNFIDENTIILVLPY